MPNARTPEVQAAIDTFEAILSGIHETSWEQIKAHIHTLEAEAAMAVDEALDHIEKCRRAVASGEFETFYNYKAPTERLARIEWSSFFFRNEPEAAATQALRDRAAEVEGALNQLLTAVTFGPEREFNGVKCFEVRVPVEFVIVANAALKPASETKGDAK